MIHEVEDLCLHRQALACTSKSEIPTIKSSFHEFIAQRGASHLRPTLQENT